MKYIDAERLKAEIERLIKSDGSLYGTKLKLQHLLSFIESLEEEQPQGLDEAAEEYACVNYDCETESDAFYHHIQIVAFKAGAEWQYQQDRAEFAKLKAKEWQDGYDEGAKWMAEQGVTKEAVIGMATEEIAINVSKKTLDSLGLGAGDKVIVQIRKIQ